MTKENILPLFHRLLPCAGLAVCFGICPKAMSEQGTHLHINGTEYCMTGGHSSNNSFMYEDTSVFFIENGGSLTGINYDNELLSAYRAANLTGVLIELTGDKSYLGDIGKDATITAISIGAQKQGCNTIGAISLTDGRMGDINGTIEAFSQQSDYSGGSFSIAQTNAYAIKLQGQASMGTISGSIHASTASSIAQAIALDFENQRANTVKFAPNASITSTSGAGMGVAIQSVQGLTLTTGGVPQCPLKPITIIGNIDASKGAFNIQSGKYDVTASQIAAQELSIQQGAQLTLSSAMAQSSIELASTIEMQLDSTPECALLILNEGSSISGVNEVIIRLSDELSDQYGQSISTGNWQDLTLAVIAASDEDAFNSFQHTEFSITNANGSELFASELGYNELGFTTGTDCFQCIPEPSTTTLSLLALAGLLAHRRRKKTARGRN